MNQSASPDRGLLELAFDHLNDAVMLLEGEAVAPEGRRMVHVNRAFLEMTGYPADQAIGLPTRVLVGPKTARDALVRLETARDAGRAAREELLVYRKDGSTFWVELEMTPVAGDDGKLAHVLVVMRDVSERKTLASRLLLADRMSSIGTLVAGVAHEINNPLTFLVCNLQLMLEHRPPHLNDDFLQMLLEAKEGADRIGAIVRDLRVFSRADSEERRVVDPRAVLDASLHLAQKVVSERATVHKRYDESARVTVVESRLGRVFLDLILNAAQSITPGDPAAQRIVLSVEGRGDQTLVSVQDSGCGIAPDVQDRVFDPFFTTKGVGHGTGLGLWIARSTVEGFGGTIEIESEVGAGTKVTVTLPSSPR